MRTSNHENNGSDGESHEHQKYDVFAGLLLQSTLFCSLVGGHFSDLSNDCVCAGFNH